MIRIGASSPLAPPRNVRIACVSGLVTTICVDGIKGQIVHRPAEQRLLTSIDLTYGVLSSPA